MHEEELAGGNTTKVMRVSDTVRRAARPQTETIHRLLKHVRAKGLPGVPEPLGRDEEGREMLSFIPGTVPHELPEWLWTEQVLIDVAKALRAWHDATIDFDQGDAIWGLPASSPREVICHNDFAPYNCVFTAGRLVGVIDFDFCSPGSRLWDLAYAGYRFIPLMPGPDTSLKHQGERSPFEVAEMHNRLNLFLDRYADGGGVERLSSSDLIRTAVDRLIALAAWTDDFARNPGKTELERHAVMYRSHSQWLGTLYGVDL